MKTNFIFKNILAFSCLFVTVQTWGQTALDSLAIDEISVFVSKGGKITNPSGTTIITKARKAVTLSKLLASTDAIDKDHALADLDDDGQNELLVYSFTGGAHCCDVVSVYRTAGVNKYQYVATMFAGHTGVSSNNTFRFGFEEHFGYFFTCYACSYPDTSDTAPIPLRAIELSYRKGKLIVTAGNQELRSMINDNLSKLGEQAYQPLENEDGMDEGLRKEVAFNLAVFYYSFGRNLSQTQQLFNKYYLFPDAKKVWSAFVKNITAIRKQNDF